MTYYSRSAATKVKQVDFNPFQTATRRTKREQSLGQWIERKKGAEIILALSRERVQGRLSVNRYRTQLKDRTKIHKFFIVL
jgi:hypothetical protein